MALENSQASTQPDGRLASMSQWVTRTPVIPLLTGLCFVAGTVFAYAGVGAPGQYYHFNDELPIFMRMAIGSFILGIGLGFPLRGGVVRIRDAGGFGRGLWVLAAVGIAWVLAFLLHGMVFYYITL